MLDDFPYRTATLWERLAAALRLDLRLYDEVSTNRSANGQCVAIVLLAGLFNGFSLVPRLGSLGIPAGLVVGLVGWFLWAAVVFFAARLLGNRPDGRSLLRTLGFADAPGLFLIAGLLPTIGAALRVLVVCWLMAATVQAVRAVFRVSRGRAVVIALAAFVFYLLLGLGSAYLTNW